MTLEVKDQFPGYTKNSVLAGEAIRILSLLK